MTSHFKQLEFMHANLKRPVKVVAGTLSFYYYSEAGKCVHIFCTGGGVLPVVETMEEVEKKINSLNEAGEK